jgi:aryl-alcohol dehydrogenase-like predicted oxidoreductase
VRDRRLGSSGLEVSVVSLGSWLTFGEAVDQDATVALVRRAFDLGITLFDTANVYARGGAEEVLGRAIAGLPRDRLAVATKVFGEVGPGPLGRGLSAAAVRYQCEQSLRRLGIEVIDLYQCHRYDPEVPLEETCAAMDELVGAGKILHWGVSEWTSEQMREAVALCAREGVLPPVSDQPRYSMLQREAQAEVLPTCAELGLGVLVFSPLAQGMLTGKYRSAADVPAGSRATGKQGQLLRERFFAPEHFARVGRLRSVADAFGMPLARLAIAWTLRRPEVTSAIVGATSPEQLEENVAAADLELSDEVVARIEEALDPRA